MPIQWKRLVVVAALGAGIASASAGVSLGAVVSTASNGASIDYTLQRNNNVADNRVLVKNSTSNANDRVGFVKIVPSAALDPVTIAQIRIATAGVASNQFGAGNTLQLWGIPDGASGEDFSQPASNTAGTWATNPLILGDSSDGSDNNVADASLTALGSVTFGAATTSGDVITFDVTSFVLADTNGIYSFLLTAVSPTADTNTPVFSNEDSTGATSGAGVGDPAFAPALLTNTDVPEPGTLALLGVAGLLLARCRR